MKQLPSAYLMKELQGRDGNLTVCNGGSKYEPKLNYDDLALARLGKKPVLKRNFGLISMTGFSSALMCTWEYILIDFFLGYQNGGPAGLIYGFLFTWFGTLSVFLAIGELSSIYPTAGGQYHWVGVLAPPSSRKFLSYITGWLTASGWVAAFAVTGFATSSLIQSIASIASPDYNPTGWQGTFIFWAILLLATLVNTVFSSVLPYLEVLILVFHILGFVATMLPLTYLAEHNSASEVFTTFANGGGWYTTGLAVMIGLNGNAGAFIGTDGAVHMSEEVQGAKKTVARSMVASTMINGFLAFAMLLAVLFTKVDYNSIASAQYPFILIVIQGTQSTAAGLTIGAVVCVMVFCSCVAALASASRVMWSMARDQGLPASSYLCRINARTTIPLTAIFTTLAIAMALGLINIGSTVVFDDFMSLLVEALFLSYLVALVLLLIGRISGRVGPKGEIQWGPWRLPGFIGLLNNVFGCLYLIVICFFSFWPTSVPVTPSNMNFSVLVTGAVIIFSTVYYFLSAGKVFEGPLMEVEVQQTEIGP